MLDIILVDPVSLFQILFKGLMTTGRQARFELAYFVPSLEFLSYQILASIGDYLF